MSKWEKMDEFEVDEGPVERSGKVAVTGTRELLVKRSTTVTY